MADKKFSAAEALQPPCCVNKLQHNVGETLLNQFAVLGLVEMEKAPSTCRRRDIVAAPKLSERLKEYAELIAAVITRHSGVDFKAPQPGIFHNCFDRVTST